MVGKQLGDAPAVYRFVRGHYYHVESTDHCRKDGLSFTKVRTRVLVYICRTKTTTINGYAFLKLFDSKSVRYSPQAYLNTPYVILHQNMMPSYRIKEVYLEDLPGYMGMNTFPSFTEVMTGTLQDRLRSIRKTKRMREIRRSK